MGRASAELGISQPVISKTIADLEHVLHVKLLDRSKRGVEPTIYGRALLRCGAAVFDELRRGVTDVEFLMDPAAGELHIGCTEPLASGFVALIVDQLSQSYPRAALHIVPGDAVSLQSRELRQRNIEMAVIPITGLAPDQDTALEVIFDDRHVIMAGKDSKWARRRKLLLADLIDEPWILPPANSTSGEYIATPSVMRDASRRMLMSCRSPYHCTCTCWRPDGSLRRYPARSYHSPNTCRLSNWP